MQPKRGSAVPGVGALVPSVPLSDDGDLLFSKVAEEVLRKQRTLIDGLTPHERSMVLEWLATAIYEGKAQTALYEILWELDFKVAPPSIETFIEDSSYLGTVASQLADVWKRDLHAVFRPGSLVSEWIFTGSIGCGKTTVAMIAMAYKLAITLCLHDPAKYYDLLPGSKIVFGVYSVTREQVQESGYIKLRGFIDSSPWFRQHFPRGKSSESLRYGQAAGVKTSATNLVVLSGSRDIHALGQDLFVFSMDEANFMRVRDDRDPAKRRGQAQDLYTATHTRLQSRFVRPGGSIPGLVLLMSSRRAQTDFLEDRMRVARDKPSAYVSEYALWEVKPASRFVMRKIRVEVGDHIAVSRILEPTDSPRAGARIVEFPGEFEQAIREDPDGALRNIAGVATLSISPFIRDRESVYEAVHEGMAHPFKRDVVTLDVKDNVRLDEYFDLLKACRVHESRWVPRLNPTRERFIHIDLALSRDCLGIAMGHVSHLAETRQLSAGAVMEPTDAPFILIDFMLRVVPPKGSEIDLSKLRGFIFFLSSLYPVTRVTFDRFQSADSIQLLNKAGVESGHQSVDASDEAYRALRSAFFDRRVLFYRYEPVIEELLELEHDARRRKVDHPKKNSHGGVGSKDVSDALAGVCWLCVNDPRAKVHNRTLHPYGPVAEDKNGGGDAAAKRTGATIPGTGVTWESLRANVEV